ncbi:MAG: MarR family transcriptional regulator [Pseudomonadales bacterium]|nr:MarR family transcriptional regulator [Pseudomonadales bacterium]
MSSKQPQVPRLKDQICFRLYAASRLVTRLYQPLLEPLGLTYPQYIVLMILWEQSPQRVSDIGQLAMLNSNTLTPLLKRLEEQGFILRQRDQQDERVVMVSLTAQGLALQESCRLIPQLLLNDNHLESSELDLLRQQLDQLLAVLSKAG